MVDEDVTAAELALGLLEGEERSAALRRMLAEPEFAVEVRRWRSYFAELFELWPEVEAPPELIDRIEAAIAPAEPAIASRLPWPVLATASSALAAALLLFIMVRPEPVPTPVPTPVPMASPMARTSPAAVTSQPLLVATLGLTAPVPAVFEPATGRLRIAAAPRVARGRIPQLWVIGSDGVPHALGLLAPSGNDLLLASADARRLAPGATLAVSAEPPGGSPQPTPSGPVVATGALIAI